VRQLIRVTKDGAVPLELNGPNAETRRAMLESPRLMKEHNARFRHAGDVFRILDESARKR
jgi:antitoxin component of RelBE/YafQ-DinJ toxin-antitoxin module